MAAKATVDTNIWVSSLLSPVGLPAQLRHAFEEGLFHVIISSPMLEELSDVLSRPKFKTRYKIMDEDIQELLILLQDRADEVLLKGDVNLCRDPDDNAIIETALRGKVKYLITGDKDVAEDKEVLAILARHGVSVISLSEFLSLIDKS